MRLPRPLLLLLLALCCAAVSHAEARATDGGERCLSANVDLRPASAGAYLYRIVFLNRCEEPRNFIWCAEHPAAALPPGIACPRAQGLPGISTESRHLIRARKEFQWHLPAGAQIRFHDCPGGELPTADFNCAAPSPPSASRR